MNELRLLSSAGAGIGEHMCILCPHCETICGLVLRKYGFVEWACSTLDCGFTEPFTLKRTIVQKVKLEEIKSDAKKLNKFIGRKCLIWAGDGQCYWLKNYCGYGGINDAGIYDFRDAFEHSNHCGTEKRIEYHFLGEQ